MTSRCRLYADREVRVYADCRPLLLKYFGPRKLAHEHDLLVDLLLRRFVAEDAAQVVDFRRDELVVLGEETLSRALEVAFRNGDRLRGTHELFAHGGSDPTQQ